jgi:hypothetical protein
MIPLIASIRYTADPAEKNTFPDLSTATPEGLYSGAEVATIFTGKAPPATVEII